MIHEFIDNNKKKIIKSKKLLFNDYSSVKNSSDGTNFQANHSECDSKDIDNESSTFFPPWLKNSLGLSQRQNQSEFN